MGWELPEEFTELRRLLEARCCRNEVNGSTCRCCGCWRAFSMAEVTKAVEDALRLRAIFLRCGETSFTVPDRATYYAAAGSAELSVPADMHRWPPRRPPTT